MSIKIGEPEEVLNAAWEAWERAYGEGYLRAVVGNQPLIEQLEAAWKLGFWCAMAAYENKVMGSVGRG